MMKTLTLIALAYISLVSACGQAVETSKSSKSGLEEVEIASTPLPVRTRSDTDTDRICAHGKCRVKAYVDGKLESETYYSEGKTSRSLLYDTSTGRLLVETASVYDENNKLVWEKLIRGWKYYDDSSDGQLYRAYVQKEIDFQYEQLRKMGITFPMPDLVVDEVIDLTTILYVLRARQPITLSPEDDKGQSVFKLDGVNESIMFKSGSINSLVGEDPVYVKRFELTVKNSSPSRETIVTENGSLSIEFAYAEGNVKKIEYRFTRDDGQISKLSKEFAYTALR